MDHAFTVRDGPTKRPQEMRISAHRDVPVIESPFGPVPPWQLASWLRTVE